MPASPAGAATSANSTVTGRRSSRAAPRLAPSEGAAGASGAWPDEGLVSRLPGPQARRAAVGGRVDPLERGGDPQAELLKSGAAALEYAGGLLRAPLSQVAADQGTRRFLAGGVVVEAREPGRRDVLGT